MSGGLGGRLVAAWHRRRGRVWQGPGRGLRIEPGPSNPDYADGSNEPPVQEVLARLLTPGATFLDVGANVGFFSALAARLVGPRGRVVAFEPVPANADLVARNAAANGLGNVEVVRAAVSDRCGRGRLVLAGHAGGASLDSVAAPPDPVGEIEVDLVTLDAWLAARPEVRPDVVKIDVEGAEPEVLDGMVGVVARHRPLLVVEYDAAAAADAEAKAAAGRGRLEELGYHVQRLPDAYPGIAWHVIHLLAEPQPGVGPTVDDSAADT
ncbi:FkbM family methyltransferase [bacterium]|nr:FkbM family methyltransferase [bacterium]